MKYIPAWKDKKGNRMIFLAPNHVYETWSEAFEYQAGDFIFYIPMGLSPAGIVEMELEDGKGQIPHVLCDGPMNSQVALIEGPLFEETMTGRTTEARG